MYRAICIHCMSTLWFNMSKERWAHLNNITMCGNGETGTPIEYTITPKPELQGTYKLHTPGLPL